MTREQAREQIRGKATKPTKKAKGNGKKANTAETPPAPPVPELEPEREDDVEGAEE